MTKPHTKYAKNSTGYPSIGIRSCVPAVLACAAILSGCNSKLEVAPTPPPVHVMRVEPRAMDVLDYFTGEVSSQQEAELRARVSGILQQKHFEDGAHVKRGDLLFTIDSRDLKAKLLEARSSLAAAQSDYKRARLDVERYRPLLSTQAISRQVYDNAVATMESSRARIETTEALVEQAKLALEYASIVSPVSGRIGAAEVFSGDLINAGSTLLAKVSTVEMSRVEFSVSEPKLIEYERVHGNIDRRQTDTNTTVKLFLSDGAEYPYEGHINFSDRALNPTTGTIRLRADFPNPDSTLRPGMFARVEVVMEKLSDVIAVPDRAVSQVLNSYFVTIVDEKNIARKVEVVVGRRQDGLWVIKDGLHPADRIVVEGIQKARNGVPVTITEQTTESNKTHDTP